MKKINKLELLCVLHGPHTKVADGTVRAVPDEFGKIWFGAEIWVDRVRMEPKHAVDIAALARSIRPRKKPYRSDFFTCGCGSAGALQYWTGCKFTIKANMSTGRFARHWQVPMA